MIAIVDYGAGNIKSVANVFAKLGADFMIASDPQVITNSKACVFPGVGAAGLTMQSLKEKGLDKAIKQIIDLGKPFLAVCVGMQTLFSHSQEDNAICLNIFKGKVKHFPPQLKSPQIGWNQVHLTKDCPLFEGINNDSYFYFVHSYYCMPAEPSLTCAVSDYGIPYTSAIWHDNVYAVQFHPEKSGDDGMKIYNNFIKQVK